MSSLAQLRDDILDEDRHLTTILRRAKVLAVRLGSDELSTWVDHELDGYPRADIVPQYRQMASFNFGTFVSPYGDQINDAPIAITLLPENIRDYANELPMTNGVAALEDLARSANDSIKLAWHPDLMTAIKANRYQGHTCIEAWKVGRGNR